MQGALPFLSALTQVDPQAPALFDDQSTDWLSYGALATKVEAIALCFQADKRGLVLCCLPQSIEGVSAYLAAAQAGHAVTLADPEAPNLDSLLQTYHPEWIVAPATVAKPDGYTQKDWNLASLSLYFKNKEQEHDLHPDFYLMLLTSGSTGSSKGVRLSYANLASNTHAIIKSLGLTDQATALCHLPLAYSFGLSVLHTQLAVGGRCLLTQDSLMSGTFWRKAREQNATLFAGVPYHYEMVMRLGLARLNLPTLTTFLQAGGKMQLPLTQKLLDEVKKREGGQLFIMYGQTEASPRISCFSLTTHPEKIGSSGQALDGGTLTIEENEIVYRGPNVMMGHATGRADLAKGDVMDGVLHTGDLGSLDIDGFLTITGRKQRFAKLFGKRVALDDLEKIASPHAFTVAIEHPEKVFLLCLKADDTALATIKNQIIAQTQLPAPWIEMRSVDDMPHKPNGKIDYQRLQSMVGAT